MYVCRRSCSGWPYPSQMESVPPRKVKHSLSVQSVAVFNAVLVSVIPEIVPSRLWMLSAASALCICRSWFLQGHEAGRIFCHAPKISLKSALCFQLFKFGRKELKDSELHPCLFWCKITDFLVFTNRRALGFGFAEGKEFSLFEVFPLSFPHSGN